MYGGGDVEDIDQADETLTLYRRLLREEAVMKAMDFEQVIFIGGLNHEQDCEGNDRADMKLPYEQDHSFSSAVRKLETWTEES